MLGSAAVGVARAADHVLLRVSSVGTVFGLLAFVAVRVHGRVRLLPGAFIAGILIGIIEAMTGYFVAPALKTVSVFILFILVLWYRPKGLFGRW